MKNDLEGYEFFEYEVEGDVSKTDVSPRIPENILAILMDTHQKVKQKKNGVIKELHHLIEKYPWVPQFKNQLGTLYQLQNNIEKANEVNHWLVREHPDYLFGKINLAMEHIHKAEYDKVPEILGPLVELKALYPERKVFHVNEIVSFCRAAIYYFAGTKNLEAAESRVQILEKFDPDSKSTEDIKTLVRTLELLKTTERVGRVSENERHITAVPKKIGEQTKLPPIFYHDEINLLYNNSVFIDHSILNDILSLPRETLIPDLHKLVRDSILRYEYFIAETKFRPRTHDFLIHAFFLLIELRSEESLDTLFDLLRQDDDFLDYWLGDYPTEEMWEVFFFLGFNRLEALKQFVMEPDHDFAGRAIMSEVVTQIGMHYPERRAEVIGWYKDIFDFFIQHKENDRILDTGVISAMVADVLDLQATELEPEIKEIFKNNLSEDSMAGNLEEVLNELHDPLIAAEKRELHPTISSMYESHIKKWNLNQHNDDFDEDDEEYFDDEFDDLYDEELPPVIPPPMLRTEPKIQRNDPCPCGSGLKHKKCHGKAD